MKGNDLVDLQQASRESNWMRSKFLAKLFTANEQQLIMFSTTPVEMVWLLWSMKEATYKIHNSYSGIREFAPLKLNCRLNRLNVDYCLGQVRVYNSLYYTESTIHTGDYIHTIAAVRATELNSTRSCLFDRNSGIDYRPMAPKSVSHHGRYLALIF